MPFLCYFSNNPSYDWRERTEDFAFQLVRARYGAMTCFNQLSILEADLAYINQRTGWVAPASHDISFQSFDLVKAISLLEEGFEPLERLLLKMSVSPQRKLFLNYSEFGFENLDYGEEL